VDVDSWIKEATATLHQRLSPHSRGEVTGALCPVCGKGKDRLVVFEEGNLWCRSCGHTGWWKNTDPRTRLEERQKSEAETAARQIRLLAVLKNNTQWREYNAAVTESSEKTLLWFSHGISQQQIETWGLGWCAECPTAEIPSPSLTIPVFYRDDLLDIRHRLILDTNNGKYRSHLAGLTPSLFNLAALDHDQVLVVEGEKKTIITNSEQRHVVGMPGAQFTRQLKKELKTREWMGELTLALDPGMEALTNRLAAELAAMPGIAVRVADFWDKPDDVFLDFGPDVFNEVLKQSRLWVHHGGKRHGANRIR